MSDVHIVQQGDSIASIAFERGLYPETIWEHPKNEALKELRKDPYILNPGDEVFIPDKQLKLEKCETRKTHRFRRLAVPEKLRIRIVGADDQPMTEEPFVLEVSTSSGEVLPRSDGETDRDGVLAVTVPPDAAKAILILGEGEDQQFLEISLSAVDPIDTLNGVQSRLANLGYYVGEEDGVFGEQTSSAIRSFQKDHDLPEILDGEQEIDNDTLEALEATCLTD